MLSRRAPGASVLPQASGLGPGLRLRLPGWRAAAVPRPSSLSEGNTNWCGRSGLAPSGIFTWRLTSPTARWYGQEKDYNVLVMDLLGPSLEDLFNFSSIMFTMKTLLMLADQMISRIEYALTKNFIHRTLSQILGIEY